MNRIVLIFLFFPALTFAQKDSTGNFPPPTLAPVISAVEATEPITVDGRLNEASWQQAPVIKDFFRIEPRQGGHYRYETFVRVIYDKKNLYFGVFCKDSLGRKGVRVQDLRRDFLFGQNDVFFVQLDPQNLKRYCVSFQTTPYGNQRDAQVFDDTFTDNDWDAPWKVRTSLAADGYYAEFAIPFSSLRYERPNEGEPVSWGVTFSRLARRDYEQTVFPAVPQAFSPYRMSYAAQLKGLKLPPPSINLRVQPYALYQYSRSVNAREETSVKSVFKAGGEIKWAVNPRSVLDFTFNTDYDHADADQAVNNLSRFNVLFPERRQFFLENNGVYAGASLSGVKPFFSRTIGLSDTQYNADPVPIDAGIRYTDRDQKRTLAGLYVHQRGTGLQPAANFGVLRYLKNYGQQNNAGLMLTQRTDEADASKGFFQKNNTTLTTDGFVRIAHNFSVNYLVSASRNNTNDSIGLAGTMSSRLSLQNWYAFYDVKFTDRKYTPGMGFIFGSNTLHHNPGGFYIWRPQKGALSRLIRRWDPGVFADVFQNTHNLKVQEVSLYLFPVYIITRSNGTIEYALYPYWQNFDSPFPILGRVIPAARYQTFRQMARFETDASRKISGAAKHEWGGYYNGSLATTILSLRVAPSPYFGATASYQHNGFKNIGADRDQLETHLYTAGVRCAYNPRIQLSAFYQYNSFDKQGRWNVRGSWEFAPLSFLYIVFNENSFQDSPVSNQSLISKLTYIKQF